MFEASVLSLSGGLTKEKDPLMEARVPIAPGFDEVWFYFAAVIDR